MTNKMKGAGVCFAAIVFLLLAAGSGEGSGETASNSKRESSAVTDSTSLPDKNNESENDFATERIVREAHPILFDTASSAEDFWKEDLADDAVVIRNASNYDQDYPNAYLILDCGQLNDDTSEKKIGTIRISFYNCSDAQLFRLKDGIEIVRSYLPTEIMKENYELRSSEYQNIWISDWESDGTKKPNFQYDYYTNYELISENKNDLPEWISIHVYLDGWGLVQDAFICTEEYKDETKEHQEWNYDYIANSDSFNSGQPCWDLALQIQYTRPSGTPALRKGNKGSEVGWLQTALNKAMSVYLSVDCSFGAGTEEKVREFQSRCELGADGVAGSQTIEMLVDILSGNKKMPEKKVTTEPPQIRIAPDPAPPQTTPSNRPSTPSNTGSGSYLLNTKTGVYHSSESCSAARRMSEENKMWISWSEAQAYRPCQKCIP